MTAHIKTTVREVAPLLIELRDSTARNRPNPEAWRRLEQVLEGCPEVRDNPEHHLGVSPEELIEFKTGVDPESHPDRCRSYGTLHREQK